MARRLPNWLETYVEFTKHSEAPDKFHFWTGVSTIAGALRRKVWIDEGTFTWLPNFYIFFVSPAGIVQKSTTVNIGMGLLEEVPGINFGPASGSWQALVQKMAECHEEFPLGDGSFIGMSALTVAASELGTFYDPRNSEQTDVLVSLWDGKQGLWSKWTKYDGGDEIINPWINIIGCTTPSWVAENMTDYFTGGGFASRSIFVYADKKRRLVAYPHKHLPENFEKTRESLIRDLRDMSRLTGPFKLSTEAEDFGEAWYADHYKNPPQNLRGEKFSGYLARKQTHIHKLAMVLSVAENDDLVIERRHLESAVEELNRIEAEMPFVFASMGREGDVTYTNEIVECLQRNGKITVSKLYREFMRVISYDTFEKSLRSLRGAGLIGMGTPQGDNRTHVWIVEPEEEKKANVGG